MASETMLEALLRSIAFKHCDGIVHVRTDALTKNYLRLVHVLTLRDAREKSRHA